MRGRTSTPCPRQRFPGGRLKPAFAPLAVALLITARNDDAELATRVGPVEVRIFVPAEAKIVRGILVHAAHYSLRTDDRWAALCRQLRFAHAALAIDLKLTNRPKKLRDGLLQGLKEFADRSGHPELLHAPRAGVGHSAGGLVAAVLLEEPGRTLTNAVSCGWILDPAKLAPEAAKVPAIFTLGAIPDDFKMLHDIEGKFVPARERGLPWGLGVQWGCAHDFGNSATLFAAWIQGIAARRLPADADPGGGAARLAELRPEDGWLGDRSTTEGTYATIASWADFKGDKAKASWFPDRATARVWRAFQSRNSPLCLTAKVRDGDVSLPAFNPKSEFGMLVSAGKEIILGASIPEGTRIRKISFLCGDEIIGTSEAAPWLVSWNPRGPGCYPLFAEWELPDGTPGVTNPALISVIPERR